MRIGTLINVLQDCPEIHSKDDMIYILDERTGQNYMFWPSDIERDADGDVVIKLVRRD
jgi:hypothetical protein